MIKAIIVDDEEKARKSLQRLLEIYCPEIEVFAQAEDVLQAVNLINEHHPDLVFLDIEMPEYNGFELFNFIKEPTFETIFVTAYHQYALKAFEVAAIDYLLKPLEAEMIIQSIEKIKQRTKKGIYQQQLAIATPVFKGDEISTLAIPLSDGITYVTIENLLYLEADGAYTNVYLENQKPILVSKRLKIFEDLLDNRTDFFRIHRSSLVHISKISKYNKGQASIQLNDGTILSVARDRKNEFDQFLKINNYSIE